ARQLARFAKNPAIQQLLADSAQRANATPSSRDGAESMRSTALRAMRDSGLKELPKRWLDAILYALRDDSIQVVRDAVSVARAIPAAKENASELASALVAVGQSQESPRETRLEALAAVPSGLSSVASEVFDFLVANLDPDNPVASRSAAVDVVAKAKLD